MMEESHHPVLFLNAPTGMISTLIKMFSFTGEGQNNIDNDISAVEGYSERLADIYIGPR
jgi:hypothetical protein